VNMAPPGRSHRQGRLNCLSGFEKCIERGATRWIFCKLRAVREKGGNRGAKNRIVPSEWADNHHNIFKKLGIKY
jgi:hypothetical protein